METAAIHAAVIAGSSDGIWAFDLSCRITVWNPAMERTTGLAAGEVVGRLVLDVFPFLAETGEERCLVAALAGGSSTAPVRPNLVSATGQDGAYEARYAPLRDAESAVVGGLCLVRDVTDRVRTEEALRASEAGLAQAQELARCGSWAWNVPADAVHWSDQLYRVFGLTPREFTASFAGFLERVHPDDREMVRETIGQALVDAAPFGYELRIVRPDGAVRDLVTRGEVECDAAGRPIRMVGIAQDVTERREGEAALRASEERYRTLVERLPAVVYRSLPGDAPDDHAAVYVSPRVRDLLGYEVDEWLADPGLWHRLIHPDDRDAVAAEDRRTEATGEPFSVDYRLLARDGTVRWVHNDAVLIRDEEGRPCYWQGVFLDVTAQKAAEAALARERDLLGLLMDSLPDQIFFKDADLRYVRMNRASARSWGIADPAQAVGKTDFDFPPDDHAAAFVADDRAVLASGQPLVNRLEPYTAPDGELRWLLTSKVPILDDAGQAVGLVGVARDVTDLQRAEEALRAAERRYRELFDAAPVMYVVTRYLEGEVIVADCNRLFLETLCYQRDDVVGRPLGAFYTPASRDSMRTAYQAALRGEFTGEERELVARDGRIVPTLLRALPDRDDAGRVVGTRAMFVDLTERKASEERLRATEARFRALIEQLPAVVYIEDVDGVPIYVSPQSREVLGRCPEEMVAEPDSWLAYIHPADRPRIDAAHVDVAGRDLPWDEVYRCIRPGGGTVWVHDQARLVVDPDGAAPYWQGIIRDVTAQKVAEEALRTSEERYRALFDHAPVMHVVTRHDPHAPVIVDCNDLFLETLGYRRDEIVGRPVVDFYDAESRAEVFGGDYARTMSGQVEDRERRLVAKGGRFVDTLLRLRPELDPDGVVRGSVAAFVDVTALKRAQRELRAAMEAAEETSRRKTQFLSMVSHELRTPMTSVRGYVELLLEGAAGDLAPDQRAFLEIVNGNTMRLGTLLNDVLDLAKIDAGRLDVAAVPVRLAEAIEQVREELAPQAAAKGIALVTSVSPLLAALADPNRLHQVLVNLVGNAVKFTERGSVTVTAHAEGERLAVAVADTGIGIAPEHLAPIFDEYRQADGSATRRFGGTGLGLAIARKLAEAQGGTIAVQSQVGVGSTFTLWLPAVPAVVDALVLDGRAVAPARRS